VWLGFCGFGLGVFIEFFKTPKAEILKKTGPGTGELKWEKIKKKTSTGPFSAPNR